MMFEVDELFFVEKNVFIFSAQAFLFHFPSDVNLPSHSMVSSMSSIERGVIADGLADLSSCNAFVTGKRARTIACAASSLEIRSPHNARASIYGFCPSADVVNQLVRCSFCAWLEIGGKDISATIVGRTKEIIPKSTAPRPISFVHAVARRFSVTGSSSTCKPGALLTEVIFQRKKQRSLSEACSNW